MAAGAINTIVGSGTLITFPTLLFFGFPPLVANVSNTIGLVAGGLTGIHGYRAELVGQGRTLRRLVPASLLGSVTGAILLLKLPASAFEAIVPLLIGSRRRVGCSRRARAGAPLPPYTPRSTPGPWPPTEAATRGQQQPNRAG